MGSLEAWLLLRSLRTLHLRVPRQSENATILAQWLSHAAGVRGRQAHSHSFLIVTQGKVYDGIPAGVIDVVWHSSLQGKNNRGWEPSAQMEGGWNPTFAILVSTRTSTTWMAVLSASFSHYQPSAHKEGIRDSAASCYKVLYRGYLIFVTDERRPNRATYIIARY